MQFQFRVRPTGGLRVIDSIPNHRLCWIEGHNGVGKTLAVRLLELATGEQPYELNPAAWRSLRAHLGEAEIIITGLRDGESLAAHRLRVLLTPDDWPEEPILHPIDPLRIGTAYLDDEEIDFNAIRAA